MNVLAILVPANAHHFVRTQNSMGVDVPGEKSNRNHKNPQDFENRPQTMDDQISYLFFKKGTLTLVSLNVTISIYKVQFASSSLYISLYLSSSLLLSAMAMAVAARLFR